MKNIFFVLLLAIPALASTNLKIVNYCGDEETRKKITMDILNNLVKEKYEDVRKDFHSSLKTTLPVEKISEIWSYVITNSGAFKKVISTTPVLTQGYNQIRLRIQFENENATLETTFTEDDKVLGLYIKP